VRAFAEAQKATPPDKPVAVKASPVARRVARELGIDIAQVSGTGPGGRIKEEDVRAYAEAPSAAQAAEGDAEWLELNSIQRLTGQRMLESGL
jgi:pyruvate dehydrogenase E2 component (dihydrolipoamide acetyltransferase)